MGKIVNSGLHKLNSVFGESVFGFAKEIRRLRQQLEVLEQDYQKSRMRQRGQQNWNSLLSLGVVLCLIGGPFLWGAFDGGSSNSSETADRINASVIFVALAAIAPGIVVTVIAISKIANQNKETAALAHHCEQIKSQIHDQRQRYAETTIQRLQHLASKRGQLPRCNQRGEGAWLFYCPSYTVMLDIMTEEMFLLNAGDCRDIKLSHRERERRSTSTGVIESAAGRALGGAAVGAMIFGGEGMITGSVIGSASERQVSFQTVETRIVEHVVDLYTKLSDYPVITLEFGDDERSAKEFYAVMATSIPSHS